MKLGPRILEEVAHKIGASLPDDMKKGKDKVKKNVRAAAEGVFQQLDLVSRKEFDAQSEMLAQSQLRIRELQKRIEELEGKNAE